MHYNSSIPEAASIALKYHLIADFTALQTCLLTKF
jgi:hypothetical protein